MNPLDAFSELTDPRSDHTKLYPLKTIVFLTISAVVAGAETWVDIELFGEERLEWIKKYVECPGNRIPSHDTIGDFFKRLDPDQFQDCFINWTSQVCGISSGELVSIDGKRVRGSYDRADNKSAIHLVSAWASDNEIVLGQLKVDEKSNEITAIPKLLAVLAIKGAIVSIDAMGCQKEIAEQIIGAGADYILSVKGNQSALLEQVEAHFSFTEPSSGDKTTEKGHGRIETRNCMVITNLDLLDEASKWKGIKAVVKVKSQRTDVLSEKSSEETRYYITSLEKPANELNALIRGHWGIENKLHWTLDVVFREDFSRVRKGDADQNFSIIRRIALNLIKLDDTPKVSQRLKRKKAGWSSLFLERLLRI